jgi:hypothetical protein
VNDTGIDGKQVFTGERNFTVQEIEVFSISLEINSLGVATFQCFEWNYALIEMLSESNQSVIQRFSHCTIVRNCYSKALPRSMNACSPTDASPDCACSQSNKNCAKLSHLIIHQLFMPPHYSHNCEQGRKCMCRNIITAVAAFVGHGGYIIPSFFFLDSGINCLSVDDQTRHEHIARHCNCRNAADTFLRPRR